jgi:pimeloyl-ACP methyl ester carboxylesterase
MGGNPGPRGEAVFHALLLPGAILPAELAYEALVEALGNDVVAVAKDLELYAGDEPPADYTLDAEVGGVMLEADAHRWGRFHLVGYSGGGAAALAVAAHRPDRLASLALIEPAWAGNSDASEAEQAVWRRFAKLDELPADEFMAAFARLQVRSGLVLPAPGIGPPPPWMAKRPAGIRALTSTFRTYDLARESLQGFDRPVYCALGALSNPALYGEIADRLSRIFDDFTLEIFEERHHMDPPHRTEPERLAASLRTLWEHAQAVRPSGTGTRSRV